MSGRALGGLLETDWWQRETPCAVVEHLEGDALSIATPSISFPRGLQMSCHSINLPGL